MITLPSGVIWGTTSSRRLALRNEIAVAPLDEATWYGSSVPCSITARPWSAVSTRGLDTTLPRWSASSAEISRFTNRVSEEPNRLIAKLAALAPEMFAAGRFTKLVLLIAVAWPRPCRLVPCSAPAPSCDDRSAAPCRLPDRVE